MTAFHAWPVELFQVKPPADAPLHPADLGVLSPYRAENVLRFGEYTNDTLHIAPPACNPALHTGAER
ncbi:hypothetical protein [Streptomyces sp. MMG1121]|uniref:hypothetical protein n=1 Tax=Streptomyces sp. MMG1121 TaxID=1415544 RepID=UPI0006B05A88|nr:hypothetical protein [Streptomyces sp. MMG1121]KOV60205.1 hypothetical protein ADK64_31645 [Streptomyces sp. MMG1121]